MTPPSSRRESGDDRRLAIAEAARDLIVEKGFEGLRTRDIAERVGINVATLHYHVPTKEALIRLVAEMLRDGFIAQAMENDRRSLSPMQQLERELDDHQELLGERRVLLSAMTELMERARRDPEVRAAVQPLLGKWREITAAILAAGRDSGDFRPDLDPVPAAQMVVSALIGFSKTSDPSVENFSRLRAEIVRSVRNPHRTSAPKDTLP